MTDKELLELAAKAAGYKNKPWVKDWKGIEGIGIVGDERSMILWNPLTDDGDALRLAVKLGIDIRPSMSGTTKFKYAWIDKKSYSDNVNDPYAATRRAIVRAAAEIGKATV